MPSKSSILERLDAGEVLVGDGGYIHELEQRGYVKAGIWTPEVVIEHPESVKELHKEFLLCGSDILQVLNFFANTDRLRMCVSEEAGRYGSSGISKEAAILAKAAAAEHNPDALIAGAVQPPDHTCKKEAQEEFKLVLDSLNECGVDFIIAEFFNNCEKLEWALEVLKPSGLPIAVNMSIGPKGDICGVSPGECAVRAARAGADIIGLNCRFDPFVSLKTMSMMKEALDEAGLKRHLMMQPLGLMTPDAGLYGYDALPEFPFATEPRCLTRWDIHRFTREAYDLGVRYIGGCCGFRPYHIRAIAEELSNERKGHLPHASKKHDPWGKGLENHPVPFIKARSGRDYWENLKPSTGRPLSSSCSTPDIDLPKGQPEKK